MIKDIAIKYINIKENTKQHHDLIDKYNTINPLPRGYKVKYNDAWCATFVSVCMLEANIPNAPYECSCSRMMNKILHQKVDLSEKNTFDLMAYDIIADKADYLVFYDWNNDGTPNHVGILYNAYKTHTADYIEVIEGNYHDEVNIRKMDVKSSLIKGIYKIPNFSTSNAHLEYIVRAVVKGVYGNGEERKKKLVEMGYDYNIVQEAVNKYLRGEKYV